MANKKILIIDDDKAMVAYMKHTLEKAGYSVLTSFSGECGIPKAKKHNPDIIITDYLMHALSGLDVITQIRNYNPKIPIVMITCIGDLSVTIKAIREGAYDYLLKPVSGEDLLNVVKRSAL